MILWKVSAKTYNSVMWMRFTGIQKPHPWHEDLWLPVTSITRTLIRQVTIWFYFICWVCTFCVSVLQLEVLQFKEVFWILFNRFYHSCSSWTAWNILKGNLQSIFIGDLLQMGNWRFFLFLCYLCVALKLLFLFGWKTLTLIVVKNCLFTGWWLHAV